MRCTVRALQSVSKRRNRGGSSGEKKKLAFVWHHNRSRSDAGCASTPPADVEVPQTDAALAAYDDLAVLTEALLLVQRHYVEEVPLQKMIYGAIDGMLLGLDPNSSFLPPEPLAELEEETRGSFSGIGVTVGLEKEGVKVIAPMEDSPAFKAGIHAAIRSRRSTVSRCPGLRSRRPSRPCVATKVLRSR